MISFKRKVNVALVLVLVWSTTSFSNDNKVAHGKWQFPNNDSMSPTNTVVEKCVFNSSYTKKCDCFGMEKSNKVMLIFAQGSNSHRTFLFLVFYRKIHFSSMFMTLFSALIFLQFIIFHPLLPNLVYLLFCDWERDWKRGRENNLCVPSYRMSIKQSKHSSSFDEMWTNTKTDRRIHKQRSVTDCLFGLEVGGKIGQKH
jgi:hypothetical protein